MDRHDTLEIKSIKSVPAYSERGRIVRNRCKCAWAAILFAVQVKRASRSLLDEHNKYGTPVS